MLCAHLFDALLSPAKKGLTSWLSFVMSYCLISIPDLCPLSCINILFARGNKKGMIFESKVKAKLFKIWFMAGKGLTSWLLLVLFIVYILLLSHVVSWVRCGT